MSCMNLRIMRWRVSSFRLMSSAFPDQPAMENWSSRTSTAPKSRDMERMVAMGRSQSFTLSTTLPSALDTCAAVCVVSCSRMSALSRAIDTSFFEIASACSASGTITLTPTSSSAPAVQVAIQLKVTEKPASKLVVGSPSLSFAVPQGSAAAGPGRTTPTRAPGARWEPGR